MYVFINVRGDVGKRPGGARDHKNDKRRKMTKKDFFSIRPFAKVIFPRGGLDAEKKLFFPFLDHWWVFGDLAWIVRFMCLGGDPG